MNMIEIVKSNYQRLLPWAEKTKTNCFRIYDRELEEFPVAIDKYADRFSVQFFAKDRRNQEPSHDLIETVNSSLVAIFNVPIKNIYWRTRAVSRPTRQHEKMEDSKEFFVVQEYGVKFKVNLRDYLDTGLFLDHRETRQMVASRAKGKKVLNLFAYTGAFSIHAAVQGDTLTKSVDMSNTYCRWCQDNFRLNGISLKNQFIIREDCLKFLREEVRKPFKYDIIIIDPPTISRSKKMAGIFDVQQDYIFLIQSALQLLNPQGVIFFSTNSRQFKFDHSKFTKCQIKEITSQTVPAEFSDKLIHRSWIITL